MKLEMQVAQVVGLSDETRWSQTAFKDNILITLELLSDGTFSAKVQGDTFLNLIIELLKKHQPQDITSFNLLISQFVDASVVQSHIQSLVIVMVSGVSIYLYCKSNGSALIKRGDQWARILEGEGSVAGSVQKQDVLICTTPTFSQLITNETVIEKFIVENNPQLASEKLGSLLHNFDNSKGAAAVFAFFHEAVNVEELKVELPEVTTPEEVIKPLTIPPADTSTPYKEKFSLPAFTFLSSPKKRILTIALILIGVLALSIIMGFNTLNKPGKNSEFTGQLETITHKVEEGEGLTDLNNLRAKTLLSEAQASLLTLSDKFKKGSKEKIEVEDLLTRTQNALALVVKAYKIDNPQVFLDLTVLKPNAIASDMSLYESKLAVLDSANISVISSDLENQSSTIVGGGSKTPNPKKIASHGNNIFVATSDGLVKIDLASKNQQVIVRKLDEVGEITDMVGYGGNIYVLDSATKKIWKFMALSDGFSTARPYLAEGETLSLIPVSFAIDGSVWVLGEGRVVKYTKGAPDSFSLQGLDEPLVNATVIYTDDVAQNIYILDKGGGRVVIFDKDGVYTSQYLWSGISGVSDMIVSEASKKILLLSGSSIYSIDLK